MFLTLGLSDGFSWPHLDYAFQARSDLCPLEAHSIHLPLVVDVNFGLSSLSLYCFSPFCNQEATWRDHAKYSTAHEKFP